ncbi:MAG TPA: hypothetical protein DIT03_04130 [Candidatus Accumulibacter sp.]|nr:hypothetical protein [Accumulibacter sp.]
MFGRLLAAGLACGLALIVVPTPGGAEDALTALRRSGAGRSVGEGKGVGLGGSRVLKKKRNCAYGRNMAEAIQGKAEDHP